MKRSFIEYTNPVLPGFYPDPSITRAGEDYYLVCSSFEYFPGVPLFHSRDLIHWKQFGHVLDRISQLDIRNCGSSDGIYAPAIRYHDGLFYMITTDVRGRGNFYVTAADPAGHWSDPISIPYGGIDPSLMFDENGRVYVTAQQGAGYDSHIIQYEIDIATGAALTEPVVIWTGDGGPWLEGPHLYKINGMYYIMAASGGTAKEHREIIGRSSSPYGPFEEWAEPILTHRELEHPIQYLGHADLIEGPDGGWWAVFLGVRLGDDGYGVLGRETYLAPVSWSEDGWPLIDNNEGTVGLEMCVERPCYSDGEEEQAAGSGCGLRKLEAAGELDKLSEAGISSEKIIKQSGSSLDEKVQDSGLYSGRHEFDDRLLPHDLVFLRNPAEHSWSLKERPGWLALKGQPAGLNDTGQTAFVGRRQQQFTAEWSTLLELDDQADSAEAGLCVRMNERAHYEAGMIRRDSQLLVFARLTVRGQTELAAEVPVNGSEGRVFLKITADYHEYRLLYSMDGKEWTQLAAGAAYELSPQAAEGNAFTGVVVGMYATGNGREMPGIAYFDWLEWQA
ncbi:glycoside hydrolase family 43 protein [Paenibacillus sp. FSL R7-0331]|uniref:glycoside hydrolase family 43 protein n=1 Tax=Paenibacillus sp. FSL R7-0331 TaxID=1536773 RepID=UPI0004F8D3B9|nr:family 43 glycosylhydrolase [Paenibacillus sp. FSL R7-0331]AIQ54810.1 xylosidase [Paenibacillus sp. FSL R7-0331]